MKSVLTVTPNPALDVYMEADQFIEDKKIRCQKVTYDPGADRGAGDSFFAGIALGFTQNLSLKECLKSAA